MPPRLNGAAPGLALPQYNVVYSLYHQPEVCGRQGVLTPLLTLPHRFRNCIAQHASIGVSRKRIAYALLLA